MRHVRHSQRAIGKWPHEPERRAAPLHRHRPRRHRGARPRRGDGVLHRDVRHDGRCTRRPNEEQGVREAMVRVGGTDSAASSCSRRSTPESTIGKFLDRSGPGLQQLAYRVADIDAVCATLRERGLRLLYDEPKRGTSNSRVNFIHPKDAGGVLVELVEPAAEGHGFEARFARPTSEHEPELLPRPQLGEPVRVGVDDDRHHGVAAGHRVVRPEHHGLAARAGPGSRRGPRPRSGAAVLVDELEPAAPCQPHPHPVGVRCDASTWSSPGRRRRAPSRRAGRGPRAAPGGRRTAAAGRRRPGCRRPSSAPTGSTSPSASGGGTEAGEGVAGAGAEHRRARRCHRGPRRRSGARAAGTPSASRPPGRSASTAPVGSGAPSSRSGAGAPVTASQTCPPTASTSSPPSVTSRPAAPPALPTSRLARSYDDRSAAPGPAHADRGLPRAAGVLRPGRGRRGGHDEARRHGHPRRTGPGAPAASRAGGSRSRSHIATVVVPISCQPPGDSRG